MVEKVKHILVELLAVLNKREVTDLRLKQKTGLRNICRHELGIFPLDCLIMVSIDDPCRRLVSSAVHFGCVCHMVPI